MLFIIAIYTLRHYLCVHSRGHQTIDHLEERGEEEEVLDNFLWQEEKGLLPVSHTLELFWKATLRKVLRDGLEHIWAFPSPQLLSCTKPIGKTVHLLFECVPWPQARLAGEVACCATGWGREDLPHLLPVHVRLISTAAQSVVHSFILPSQ